jgi:hypothetical protein
MSLIGRDAASWKLRTYAEEACWFLRFGDGQTFRQNALELSTQLIPEHPIHGSTFPAGDNAKVGDNKILLV